MPTDLLSTTQAAALLSVGPTSIKRWADEGRLRCIKTVGGHRRFHRADLLALNADEPPSERPLSTLSEAEQDALDHGLIGFDDHLTVFAYNAWESRFAGIDKAEAIGRDIFAELVPCTGNRLVAGRFAEARRNRSDLRHRIDYVFTYRMRPTPVRLELRREEATGTNWLLVFPPAGG